MSEKKIEAYIPLAYSIIREMKRFRLSFIGSVLRFIASNTQYYLWIPIYSLFLIGELNDVTNYLKILIYLLGFFILYETGYLISDNISIRYETKKIRNEVYKTPISLAALMSGIFIRIASAAALIILSSRLFGLHFDGIVMAMYLFMILIFLIHSALDEKYRVITFLGLRLQKSIAPYSFLVVKLAIHDQLLILSGILGIAIYFSYEYFIRKQGYKQEMDMFLEKYSIYQYAIVFTLAVFFAIIFSIPAASFSLFALVISLNHLAFMIFISIKRRLSR